MASSLSIPIIRITDKTGKPRIVLEFGKSRKKKIEESLSKNDFDVRGLIEQGWREENGD